MLTCRRGIALAFVSLLPWVSSLPLLATSGCGGRTQGEPTPTTALTDGSAPLWNDHLPDAAPPPILEDAATIDPSPDAAPPFHVDPDPLAHCPPSVRDAFYVNVVGVPGPVGSYTPGSQTFTDLDSYFWVDSPYAIVTHRVSGEGDSIAITTADGGALAPGRYELGSSSAPTLALTLGFQLDECTAASGTLDVIDSQSVTDDAGAPLPASAVLAFEIQCEGSYGSVPVEGCARYAPSPAVDAGLPASASDDDGGVLAPCASGGNVFYVDGTGESIPGPAKIDGTVGTWSAGIDFIPAPLLQFDANVWPLWELAFAADSFVPGTYTLSGDGYTGTPPAIDVLANGGGCDYTTGTVTLATIQTTPGTNGAPGLNVTRLLMGFDLACDGSPVRGCLSFGMP